MNNSKLKKLIIVVAFSIIAITLAFSFYYRQNQNAQNDNNNAYANYLQYVTDKSVNLTRTYQDEIAIWNAHQYSNSTMSKITEAYIPKFISQLNQFKNIEAPAKYSKVKEAYIKSFDSEIKSYRLFDEYLKTNNVTANKLSTDYLSFALTNETIARNAFAQANNNNNSGR